MSAIINLGNFQTDSLVYVFQRLDARSLFACAQVNHSWNEILSEDSVWKKTEELKWITTIFYSKLPLPNETSKELVRKNLSKILYSEEEVLEVISAFVHQHPNYKNAKLLIEYPYEKKLDDSTLELLKTHKTFNQAGVLRTFLEPEQTLTLSRTLKVGIYVSPDNRNKFPTQRFICMTPFYKEESSYAHPDTPMSIHQREDCDDGQREYHLSLFSTPYAAAFNKRDLFANMYVCWDTTSSYLIDKRIFLDLEYPPRASVYLNDINHPLVNKLRALFNEKVDEFIDDCKLTDRMIKAVTVLSGMAAGLLLSRRFR